ncbi:MAG: major facilitator superfamily domain-containing protein [Podila humilis]|nr:MAG: major facilitator superfamily domain-containing protein [Podila humilis]
MVLHQAPSNDGTLANNSISSSSNTVDGYDDGNGDSLEPPLGSQLESFPPLFITRSNVLNSPSVRVEPAQSLDSRHNARRWFILSLSCLLLFGNYFAYDNPAALNTQLQEYLGLPYNEYQYLLSTLYSVYSLPNTVLPFLFGHMVDRFGPHRVLLGLSGCVCVGQAIFSMGVARRQIWMMLAGRAIFGVGGESCGVAQASMTTMHFRGHELAFALGLNLCIARFGSVVNTLVTPWAEQKWGVPTAVWIGTLSCVMSFLSAVCLVILNMPAAGSANVSKEEAECTPLLTVQDTTHTDTSSRYLTQTTSQNEDTTSPLERSSILNHLPGILRREASFTESVHSVRFEPGYSKSGIRPSLHILTDQATLELNNRHLWWHQWWDDMRFFPLTFWLLCALTVLLYGTVVPFNNIASDFLQSKWYPGNPRKATAVMGIPDTLGAVLVPAFGIVVDRYGGRASTLIASAFIMIIVHSTLAFTTLSPIYAFTLLGIAYTMYGVALWPSIACVVTSELHLGKGYGISSSFLNISLTLVPPIVATIRVNSEDFLPVEIFFISMGICGVIVGFVLKQIDYRDGGALEDPEIEVEVPVIVPQASVSTSTSVATSPAMSHSARMKSTKWKQRPQLNSLQNPMSEWSPRDGYMSSPLTYKSQKAADDGVRDSTRSIGSPYTETSTSHLRGRARRWIDRPLLQRTLTRVGSPLLQQHSSSPQYGSFSSPSIVTMGNDAQWDDEEAAPRSAGLNGYGVTQHPILYNPLRGSSGSFRVNRNTRPVAFGEGEEGRIYLDGQEVEAGSDGQGYDFEDDLSNTVDGDDQDKDPGYDPDAHEETREGPPLSSSHESIVEHVASDTN